MATVELRLTALPAHVRTARLIAAAVARRTGVPESLLDEVRLAVGEACSRAVGLHRQFCPDRPVEISLSDDDGLVVVVRDSAPPQGPVDLDALGSLEHVVGDEVEVGDGGFADPLPSGVGLAVIGGLVDDFEVTSDESGAQVRMHWPAGDAA